MEQAIEYMVIISYFALTFLFLIICIIKRKKRIVSLGFGTIFIGMIFFALHIYNGIQKTKLIESTKFLGNYKLLNLDKKPCKNCIVKLHANYQYDIISKGKVIGNGKWDIQTATDIPNYYLEIENGPGYVFSEHERVIDYIIRK